MGRIITAAAIQMQMSRSIEDNIEKARIYHHSTAAQAAMVARDANVGKLLLGHYSSRYRDESVLLDEAKAIFPNSYLTNEKLVFDV